MKPAALCLNLVFAALLSSCVAGDDQKENTVGARDYDAFWLWAGVKPQPVLDDAKTIYLMAGEIQAGENEQIESLRAVPTVHHADLWLVLRVETLDWSPPQYAALNAQVERWQKASNLIGVQIDFDANTRNLDRYAAFLADIRTQLPGRYKLSITGLMDWSANGDPSQLNQLAGVVDEVVFQTYQGRKTIAGYQKFMQNLDKLPMPFRIGLVQDGEWQPPDSLDENPNFKGYVVFLLNSENERPN